MAPWVDDDRYVRCAPPLMPCKSMKPVAMLMVVAVDAYIETMTRHWETRSQEKNLFHRAVGMGKLTDCNG